MAHSLGVVKSHACEKEDLDMTDTWGGESAAIAVKVNGETVGTAQGTDTLGSIANRYASQHSLKTFSVLVNGAKADTSAGSKTLADLGATSVELVAKDSRG
jgi:hypothetical protein